LRDHRVRRECECEAKQCECPSDSWDYHRILPSLYRTGLRISWNNNSRRLEFGGMRKPFCADAKRHRRRTRSDTSQIFVKIIGRP